MIKITRFLTIALLLAVLVGCTKNEPTPPYHKDIFRCKVNGIEWVAACPSDSQDGLSDVLAALHVEGINHVLVEGGREVLADFLRLEAWDEAFVAVSPVLLGTGVRGPGGLGRAEDRFSIGDDTWWWFLIRQLDKV